MPLSPEELSELAALPGPALRKRVKELQEKGIIPKFGWYAEAEGDLDTGGLSSGFKTWDKSPYKREQLKKEHREGHTKSVSFDLPDIKKRTNAERVESMALRLFQAAQKNPWEMELILKDLAKEYWKQGKPISFEEMKALAAPFIEKAAKKAKDGK